MPKLTKETRYFGDGLPESGVADPLEAYQLGLKHARFRAVEIWRAREARSSASLHHAIAEQWDTLVRAISAATDAYVAENGTAVDLIVEAEHLDSVATSEHLEDLIARTPESGA